MSDPFSVYRETYHDTSVTDREGRILKRAPDPVDLEEFDHDIDDHEDRPATPQMIKVKHDDR